MSRLNGDHMIKAYSVAVATLPNLTPMLRLQRFSTSLSFTIMQKIFEEILSE